MDAEMPATVFQSLDAIRKSLRQIEHEFSKAMDLADTASLLLELERLGPAPSEVKKPLDGAWYRGPLKDNASDQLICIYDVMQSKRGDIEFVHTLIDEAVWLTANGRIKPGNG